MKLAFWKKEEKSANEEQPEEIRELKNAIDKLCRWTKQRYWGSQAVGIAILIVLSIYVAKNSITLPGAPWSLILGLTAGTMPSVIIYLLSQAVFRFRKSSPLAQSLRKVNDARALKPLLEGRGRLFLAPDARQVIDSIFEEILPGVTADDIAAMNGLERRKLVQLAHTKNERLTLIVLALLSKHGVQDAVPNVQYLVQSRNPRITKAAQECVRLLELRFQEVSDDYLLPDEETTKLIQEAQEAHRDRQRSIQLMLLFSAAGMIGCLGMLFSSGKTINWLFRAHPVLLFLPPLLPFIFFSPVIMVLFCSIKKIRHYSEVRERLDKVNDVRALGALLDASKDQTEYSFRQTFLRLLPRLTARDAELLTKSQRQQLYRLLFPNSTPQFLLPLAYDTELVVAILKALEQVGTQEAIPHVEKLIASTQSAPVRQAAGECLEFLREYARQVQFRDTLLRPSDREGMAPETLLRPAGHAPESPPEHLLRPAESETATTISATFGVQEAEPIAEQTLRQQQ